MCFEIDQIQKSSVEIWKSSAESDVRCIELIRANCLFVFAQKMEDKLEEVLREFKSLRDRVILQDRRIARLEEQVAKVAM